MLKTRIITALILAGGLLSVLFLLPHSSVPFFFVGIVAVAAWEWAGLLRMGPVARIGYGLFIAILCLALLGAGLPVAWLKSLWSLAIVFWLVAVPLWFRFRWPLGNLLSGGLVGGLLLVPSWAAMVALYQRDPWLLLAAMALVWVADISAYFVGRRFGRRKLAPTISPGKTWEGAAGAALGVLIYGVLIGNSTGNLAAFDPVQCVLAVLGLILLTAVSIIGDLFESLAKREAGVKDSSALLPGHGGVLDRIDSLISTLPFAALAATMLFAPVP